MPSDPKSLERGVRQGLADKVAGNLLGLWLLIPELLRLGVWDLLCGWTGRRGAMWIAFCGVMDCAWRQRCRE